MKHVTRNSFAASTAILLLMAGSAPSLADIRASLSQRQVAIGDSFTLDLNVTGQPDGALPDLAPLEKDFAIAGTSEKSSTSVVNGVVSNSHGWTITLSPRSVGKAVIPAIRVGAESSRPTSIEVVDAASLPRAELGDSGLQVDMSVPDGTHYVQQEIPVTVRAMASEALRDARLSAPSTPDAIVRQTGSDKTYSQTVNGRPVTVIERTYLVTPQKSGTLTLPPVTLRGRVDDPDARDSLFGGDDPFEAMRKRFGFAGFGGSMGFGGSLIDEIMNPGRQVAARSQALSLDIEARPGDQASWFLPATKVEIDSQWNSANPSFTVGGATSRKVRLVAHGATSEQLPELSFPEADGARIYVDRVDDRTIDADGGSAAVKQYQLSIVPTRIGAVTLPAVEVEWLDTASGERKVATLAAETIQVSGGPAASGPAATPHKTQPGAQEKPDDPASAVAADEGMDNRQVAILSGLLVLLLAGAAAASLRRWRRGGKPMSGRPLPQAERPGGLARLRDADGRQYGAGEAGAAAAAALRAACRRNDAAGAFSGLQAWLAANATTVRQFLGQASPEMREAFRELEACLYGDGTIRRWTGKKLLGALDEARVAAASGRSGRNAGLPPLYASQSAACLGDRPPGHSNANGHDTPSPTK